MNISNQPLSDAEIDTLDTFLTSDSTFEEVLAIDELHGYLTAIVCCPVPVMPSDWLAGTLTNAERAIQIGGFHMWRLAPVEQKIHDADRMRYPAGPGVRPSLLQRRRTLAAQCRDRIANELAVFVVEVLGGERIRNRHDFAEPCFQRFWYFFRFGRGHLEICRRWIAWAACSSPASNVTAPHRTARC